METEDAITQLPGESDASVVARRFAHAFDGNADDAAEFPIQLFGATFIVILGPHSPDPDTGWCWCQAEVVACPGGGAHTHIAHKDIAH